MCVCTYIHIHLTFRYVHLHPFRRSKAHALLFPDAEEPKAGGSSGSSNAVPGLLASLQALLADPVLSTLAIETTEAAARDALAQGAQARAQALSLLFVGPEPQAATAAAAAAITAVVDVSGTPPASHSRALSAAGALRRDAVLAAQQAAYNAYTGLSLFPGLQRGLDAAPALRWLAWVMGWAYKVGFGETEVL